MKRKHIRVRACKCLREEPGRDWYQYIHPSIHFATFEEHGNIPTLNLPSATDICAGVCYPRRFLLRHRFAITLASTLERPSCKPTRTFTSVTVSKSRLKSKRMHLQLFVSTNVKFVWPCAAKPEAQSQHRHADNPRLTGRHCSRRFPS